VKEIKLNSILCSLNILTLDFFQNLLCLGKRCFFEQIFRQILRAIWVHIAEEFADKDAEKHAF